MTNENTMLGSLDSDDLLVVRKEVKLLCKYHRLLLGAGLVLLRLSYILGHPGEARLRSPSLHSISSAVPMRRWMTYWMPRVQQS